MIVSFERRSNYSELFPSEEWLGFDDMMGQCKKYVNLAANTVALSLYFVINICLKKRVMKNSLV